MYSSFEGLFANERAVVIKAYDGSPSSLLVDERSIARRDDREFLVVRVIEEDEDSYVVLLPSEIVGGGRTIAVAQEQVTV